MFTVAFEISVWNPDVRTAILSLYNTTMMIKVTKQ